VRKIGPYEVLRILGQGGMAEVYLVQALTGKLVGRQLALKRLLPSRRGDEDAQRRFTSEAELFTW
jgi:eukaryotic-like serine/threonine-protein kinase